MRYTRRNRSSGIKSTLFLACVLSWGAMIGLDQQALAAQAAPGSGGGAHGAGSTTTAATGAAAQSSRAQTQGHTAQAPATPGTEPEVAQGPQSYAASAPAGTDPRKPPPATPGALTLQQVVELAKSSNPTILAAEANLRSVRALEIQAAVRTNPYLGVAGADITADASNNNPYQYSVQL